MLLIESFYLKKTFFITTVLLLKCVVQFLLMQVKMEDCFKNVHNQNSFQMQNQMVEIIFKSEV